MSDVQTRTLVSDLRFVEEGLTLTDRAKRTGDGLGSFRGVRSGSRIDQAQFTCARASYNGYPGQGSAQTTDTQTGTYGNNGGTLRTPTRCGAGEFVAGFYGRAGSRIDQLGVLCRAYSVTTR